jgi:hypothetical protein
MTHWLGTGRLIDPTAGFTTTRGDGENHEIAQKKKKRHNGRDCVLDCHAIFHLFLLCVYSAGV